MLVQTYILFGTLFTLASSAWYSWNKEAFLVVKNLRRQPIESISVTNVDPFDFEGGHSPQDMFKEVVIGARRSVTKSITVNNWASKCPFTMTFVFADFTKATFKINMKYALDDAEAEFWWEGPYDIHHKKQGNTIIIAVSDKK